VEVRLDIYGLPRFFEAFLTPAIGTLAAAVRQDLEGLRRHSV
jgi:hypothetical protein